MYKLSELNPELRARVAAAMAAEDALKYSVVFFPATSGQRIKQERGPLLNKSEQEWFDILSAQFPNFPRPRPQAKRYRLANGFWYKPDVSATSWPADQGPARETCWEVKGPKQVKGVAKGLATLKVAASSWPEVCWILVWKENGQWKQQQVLP